MNDHDNAIPEPEDDPVLDELLSPLKRLEPPMEARVANRIAIAAELREPGNRNWQGHLPWWRRSIAVPLPIAASVVVLAALALSSSVRGWQERSAAPVQTPTGPTAGRPTEAAGEAKDIAKRASRARPVVRYYETETYLCGIGRVNSESRYSIKE